MTDPSIPALGARLRPLLIVGMLVGAARYVAEFVAPEHAMLFGLYYVMPVVLAVVGLRGAWGPIGWRPMAGTVVVAAFTCWGAWNTLAYTTGQFLEWSHGRFYSGDADGDGARAAPIAASWFAKIGWGIAQGALTGVAGSVWCTVFGTVLVWLPARLRQRA